MWCGQLHGVDGLVVMQCVRRRAVQPWWSNAMCRVRCRKILLHVWCGLVYVVCVGLVQQRERVDELYDLYGGTVHGVSNSGVHDVCSRAVQPWWSNAVCRVCYRHLLVCSKRWQLHDVSSRTVQQRHGSDVVHRVCGRTVQPWWQHGVCNVSWRVVHVVVRTGQLYGVCGGSVFPRWLSAVCKLCRGKLHGGGIECELHDVCVGSVCDDGRCDGLHGVCGGNVHDIADVRVCDVSRRQLQQRC